MKFEMNNRGHCLHYTRASANTRMKSSRTITICGKFWYRNLNQTVRIKSGIEVKQSVPSMNMSAAVP